MYAIKASASGKPHRQASKFSLSEEFCGLQYSSWARGHHNQYAGPGSAEAAHHTRGIKHCYERVLAPLPQVMATISDLPWEDLANHTVIRQRDRNNVKLFPRDSLMELARTCTVIEQKLSEPLKSRVVRCPQCAQRSMRRLRHCNVCKEVFCTSRCMEENMWWHAPMCDGCDGHFSWVLH